MIQASSPNPYQVLAWLAAGIGAGIALIQLIFNSIRERRTRRQDQARFGFELLDALFDDVAGDVLRKIDRATWSTDPGTEDAKFLASFKQAFTPGRPSKDPSIIAARLEFDRVLYYLERIQHSIEAKLTVLDDVRPGLAWYAQLLAPYRVGIKAYAEGVHHHRAATLLNDLHKSTGDRQLTRDNSATA